ncbi:GNAT superfamily N-acetyltransferase [Bacillus sp. SORGH_AS 510]|uniref:GNAT family N-acetyltransferase n=1 Tax=Bacillus sp. SORGH_AS_0510 TaxID=3041771 RepID=UPI00278AF5BC|nr:GNAT family N-acetyltransferase [Bacillus sp. SORGH_AS_0510]MDQ1147002.1 GNAT superfamily N-acetyltransferase [Bacillus sp. SORGH_AS_0510]
METLVLEKGYKDNVALRNSFNELALQTFGIEFETWYQHGFWTEKYQPYSYIDQGKVVANVSVNLLNMVIDGESKKAIQIGTVMTHPDYRNKGLSRKLMEFVLEDFNHVDFIYLFANQTVLDFYPKFGFKAVNEVQYSMNYDLKPMGQSGIRKLDGTNAEDLSFIYSFASNRKSVSQVFGTTDSEELLMFYCIMVFSQDLYFIEEEKALVIFQQEDDMLHLYDIVSSEEVNLQSIISQTASKETRKIVFHFHVENQELLLWDEKYQSSNVLFVKNLTNVSLPEKFKHPMTSQA